jgi:hypothetical protein
MNDQNAHAAHVVGFAKVSQASALSAQITDKTLANRLEARARIELANLGFAVLYLRSSKALASTTCILPCPTFVRSFCTVS